MKPGQALEPACWIPILKGKKLVLAGDHHQLPPTVKSDEAAKNGLDKTLLEKCWPLPASGGHAGRTIPDARNDHGIFVRRFL